MSGTVCGSVIGPRKPSSMEDRLRCPAEIHDAALNVGNGLGPALGPESNQAGKSAGVAGFAVWQVDGALADTEQSANARRKATGRTQRAHYSRNVVLTRQRPILAMTTSAIAK